MRAGCLGVLWAVLLLGCRGGEEPPAATPPRFTLLPPDSTGVSFVNRLTEGPNTNVLVYEYFYNGGGVATGDFDADGRPDLYFVGNMSDNALYLNLGNLRFTEVTRASGAGGRPGPWQTGVTVVDINRDGLDDIYLSYSGMLPEEKRRNQLFVNQGNDADGVPRFTDRAADYGLDFPGFTNQAYFFDYDADGDQDVLLLNHNPKSLPVLNPERTRYLLEVPDRERGLRLLRNDDDRYHDVTERAGLNGSELSYGLGLALSDLDGDGDTDVYVSNDYEVPDYLYINNGNGTFTDRLAERLTFSSHFSMGSDIADVNNDGRPDLLTLDMLPPDNRRRKLLMADDNRSRHANNAASGFAPQHMRNMLHLAQTDSSYAEIGQLAGISATDWSWSALLSDFDNDGHADLHVTNGYLRDYTNLDFIKYMDDYVETRGRLQRKDLRELLQQMPASGVSNQVFHNLGNGTFTNTTEAWGLQRPSNSNGALTLDLDGDGDLDLVTNNLDALAFVYRNDGPANNYLMVQLLDTSGQAATGARVTITTEAGVQLRELFPNRGYLSSGPRELHFGLGATTQVQSVSVRWPDGAVEELPKVPANQVLTLYHHRARRANGNSSPPSEPLAYFASAGRMLPYPARQAALADFDRQALLPAALSGPGPILATADLNDDGYADLVVGSAGDRPTQIYFGQAGGSLGNESVAIAGTADHECTRLYPFDLDGDGDLDLYQANGGYGQLAAGAANLADLCLYNDGTSQFTAVVMPAAQTTGAAALSRRGDTTLLFTGGSVTPGAYPLAGPAGLWYRTAEEEFRPLPLRSSAPLHDLGIVTDAAWADLDQDGQEELIVVGQWMPIRVFEWVGDRLIETSADYFAAWTHGWWHSLLVADFNGDGRPDLLVGNRGNNHRWLPSVAVPAELFAADLDGNGAVDPILTFVEADRRYPEAGRDELLSQIPKLRARYTNYASYADATAGEILAAAGGSDLTPLRVVTSATTLYLQGPAGQMERADLPREAQYGPAYASATLDVNGDGHLDVLLAGDETAAKLSRGPTAGLTPTLLLGDGKGAFTYIDRARTGLPVRGEVRSVSVTPNQVWLGLRGKGIAHFKRRDL